MTILSILRSVRLLLHIIRSCYRLSSVSVVVVPFDSLWKDALTWPCITSFNCYWSGWLLCRKQCNFSNLWSCNMRPRKLFFLTWGILACAKILYFLCYWAKPYRGPGQSRWNAFDCCALLRFLQSGIVISYEFIHQNMYMSVLRRATILCAVRRADCSGKYCQVGWYSEAVNYYLVNPLSWQWQYLFDSVIIKNVAIGTAMDTAVSPARWQLGLPM